MRYSGSLDSQSANSVSANATRRRPRRLRRLLALLLCCVPVTARGQVAESAAPTLAPGRPTEVELKGGERHLYQIALKKHQSVQITVEQSGIDVVVSLLDAGDRKLVEMDSPNGADGPELLAWVAEDAATYRVEVRAITKTAAPGRYVIEVTEPRKAHDFDRRLAAAAASLAEAARLQDQNGGESSPQSQEKYQQTAAAAEQALATHHARKDPHGAALAHYHLGLAYDALGQKAKALDSFQQALALYRAAGDRRREADALQMIVAAYYNQGEYQKALDVAQQEVAARHATGDMRGEGRALNTAGVIHDSLKDSRRAAEAYNQALPLHRQAGNRAGEATTLGNLADTRRSLGEMKEAIEAFNQALPLWQALGRRREEARTLRAIGNVYFQTDPKTAGQTRSLSYLKKARAIYHELGDRRTEASLLYDIGYIINSTAYAGMPQPEARESYQQALALYGEAKDLQGEADARARLAEIGLSFMKLHTSGGKGAEAQQEREAARALFEPALAYYREKGDKAEAARVLLGLVALDESAGKMADALEKSREAFALYQEVKSPRGAPNALSSVGRMQLALRDGAGALASFKRTLDLYREVKDQRAEAINWGYVGLAEWLLGDKEKGREAFNQMFQLRRADSKEALAFIIKSIPADLYDPELLEKQQKVLDAPALASAEAVYDWLTFGSPFSWDELFVVSGQAVFRATGDLAGEDALTLSSMMGLQFELATANEHLRALLKQNELLKEALRQRMAKEPNAKVEQAAAEPPKERDADRAERLFKAGEHLSRRDSQAALRNFQQALEIRRALGDRRGQVEALMRLGAVWFHLSEVEKALSSYQEALAIARADGDTAREAGLLVAIGGAQNWLGDRQQALALFQQALALQRAAKDKDPARQRERDSSSGTNEATTLLKIGDTYLALGEKQKALQHFTQVREMTRSEQHPEGDAFALARIGLVYQSLNEERQTREFYVKSLIEFRRKLNKTLIVSNLKEKAALYNDLGDAHYRLGLMAEALGTFRQGLSLQRQFGSLSDQAYALNKMGLIYLASKDAGQMRQALQFFAEALKLRRADKNPAQEAEALHNLASAYETLGERQRALALFQQALALRHRLKDPEGEGETLDRLMRLWQRMSQPRLAVFFGKQAVNAFQQIRSNIQGLDKDLQKSFINSRTDTYRVLADLLITQNRLPEAQQVLELLKKEEYLEFIRRDGGDAAGGGSALNAKEAEAKRRADAIQDRIVAGSRRLGDLRLKESLTAAERAEAARLERDLVLANEAFDQFLAALPKEFAETEKGETVADALRNAEGLQESLREMGDGTVALYTVITPEKYHVILFTPETQVTGSTDIKADDLKRKIRQFYRLLQHPELDPRPLAQELYKIVVGPVEASLRAAGAKTLMWSLDGMLHYLPLAALYDGEHYLIERYRTAIFTPVSHSRLERPAVSKWRGLGLGVSKGADPLPFVTDELRGIIRDDADPDSGAGVISGRILLDESFTKEKLKEALATGRRYSVVHIASHFRFKPGNEYDSYLLLGGQEQDTDERRHLKLAQIKNGEIQFRGVELLTLSACNTAVGGGGAEVENFAALAQLRGARAVIATLWPVADRSTMRLMQTFYRLHDQSPGQPKLEALRQAQLALLRGAAGDEAAMSRRGDQSGKAGDEAGDDDLSAPPFKPDPRAPFAHPYFWAPFILIGNWR